MVPSRTWCRDRFPQRDISADWLNNMDVLLVHGYNVTSTKTYGVLPARLKTAAHRIKNVYLSKYVTLDNELTLDDLVRAFQAALVDICGTSLGKTRFAC